MNYDNITDPYGMKPNKKTFGYPTGDFTEKQSGIVLRDVEVFRLVSLALPFPALATTNYMVNILTIPRGRAGLMEWFSPGGDHSYQGNFDFQYQLWANNQRVATGVGGQYRANINVYLPPETIVTYYLQGINNDVTTYYQRGSLKVITFSEKEHPWEFGSGGFKQNPGAWPP